MSTVSSGRCSDTSIYWLVDDSCCDIDGVWRIDELPHLGVVDREDGHRLQERGDIHRISSCSLESGLNTILHIRWFVNPRIWVHSSVLDCKDLLSNLFDWCMATSEISGQLELPVWITSTLYARYRMDKFTSSMARS
jgi:hypothetical protein